MYTEDIAQDNALQSIAVSFDRTIQSGREGINQYRTLPKAITNHPAYPQYLKNQSARDQDSGRKEIVEFLSPRRGMKFVDLGCCLNLIDHGYSLQPSEYYGVDISSEVMQELDNFLKPNGLEIGGLYYCGIHQVPVPENFFDIGTCIGSLEYFRSTYIARSLNEFHRILKPGAKFVLDIPNPCSKEYRLSQKIESYLGRGDEFDLTVSDFERLLQGRFTIVRRDALGMFQYFLICCKQRSTYGKYHHPTSIRLLYANSRSSTAQAYLKQQGVVAKLYDLSAELQTVLLQQGEMLPKICGEFEADDVSAVHRYAIVTKALFGNDSIPFQISYDSFTSHWDWKAPNDLANLLSTHAALLPYIEQRPSFPELETSTYVAFSISFESQIIPAPLVAARIWQQRKLPIIFGGSFFYNYAEIFLKLMSALDLADCLIIGPGERILEAIGRNGILETARSGQFAVSAVFGKTLLRQKPGERCPEVYLPDFTDLDFSRYFSSVKAFPYMIRNICYYGGCRFCNDDRDCGTAQSKDFRQAFLSMSKIAKADNIYNVYIVDAGLSPHDLRMISGMEASVPFSWIANARFEKELAQEELIQGLRLKGCRMLRFGLESGSQRVLDLMNKGTEESVAASILQKLHDVGILTHVYLMFGYLGETNADRAETLQFLEQNRRYISSYSVSIFQPIPGTLVYDEALSRLHLPISCSADEEYQRILAEIYPSESAYQDILQTVEKVKLVLAGYARTNAEFYSANIFSEEQCSSETDDVLSIQFAPL